MRFGAIILFLLVTFSANATTYYVGSSVTNSGSGVDPANCTNALTGSATNIFVGNLTGPFSVPAGSAGHPTTLMWTNGAEFKAPTWAGLDINANGILYWTDASYILVDGSGSATNIECTDNGVGLGSANVFNCIFFEGVCNSIEIRNMGITNIMRRSQNDTDIGSGQGITYNLHDSQDVLIHNNRIGMIGNAIEQNWAGTLTNIQVYSNDLEYVSFGIFFGTTSAGASDGVMFFANTVNHQDNWDDPLDLNHQDGIHVTSGHTGGTNYNLVISRNHIGPLNGTNNSACIFFYPDEHGKFVGTKIINNILLCNSDQDNHDRMIQTINVDNALIANNTFVNFLVAGGFQFGQGMGGIRTGDGALVYNNAQTNGTWGLQLDTAITVSDYNDMSMIPGNGTWQLPSSSQVDWSGWQANGYDPHGTILPPNWDSNFAPLANDTVLIGKGTNLSAYFTTDYYGRSRPTVGAWTVGAIEGSSTNVTADFTGTPLSGAAPLNVVFTDSSVNATNWSWAFGDSGTSTTENPSHTYSSAGTYTVALTIIGLGQTDTKTRTGYVSVSAPVVPQTSAVTFSGVTLSGISK